MFVLWSVYCFIMSCTFQSVLMSFLTMPTYEKQISNIRELAESDLNYGGFTTVREVFNFTSNKYNYKIFANWINCPVTEECINRTAEQRDFAVYKNSRQVNYLSNYYVDSEGRSKLYRFKENQIYYIWAAFTKNFPIYAKYNELALRAGQAGLIEKWDKDTQSLIQETEYSRGTIPLTMNDLKLAFIVLLLGHALSFCTFLYEIRKIAKIQFAHTYNLHLMNRERSK
ncbi:ionotropic receptor 20a-related [Holotrichia oblita]|uniref:Ionotropic receptor 20a-related n=1 Tax=Holotrichia oblita TaxID=644536 RepID=A0ACB9TVW1_HOLOL|nr:ionotropic receptor 20a-related [Holotrichia oblita]